MKSEPVFYPVYNSSVAQDSGSSTSDESYESAHSYDAKANSYSSSSYAAPSPSYPATYSVHSVPSASYGAPSSHYGSPGVASYYPAPTYGPPTSYYPSPPVTQIVHHLPEAQKSHSDWFLSKILKKFDLVFISKILLKLLIFKKIVKFIGVACLLLFIPILKKKFEEHTSEEEEEEDEGRKFNKLDKYGKKFKLSLAKIY